MNRTRILCFGDSNTWGYNAAGKCRYDDDLRWTQLLQRLLGDRYQVVEEGLCGRTSVFHDPIAEGMSGVAALPYILPAHAPIDWMLLMLGTNDCKQRFSATAGNIASGVERLAQQAMAMPVWRGKPNILIIAPLKMDKRLFEVPDVAQMMGEGSVEKGDALPELLEAAAKRLNLPYMDCNDFARPIEGDWMHFSPESIAPFAKGVYDRLMMLGA